MWSRFTSHLYVRIWLAVVVAVALLTFLVGWAWRLSTDVQLPIREVMVRNEAGQLIGTAQTRPDRRPGQDLEFDVVTSDGRTLDIQLPRPTRPAANLWIRPPFGFFWTLILVGLAVALGAYPIIRRLTLRLEGLQRGVERWGSGDLSARVVVQGSDEVAFLAERFNHAAERIETLMETQKSLLVSHKTLLANASHELRSPLARIRMGLELMQAPTLVASRTARPPEGAGLAWGGPALAAEAPTLVASRTALSLRQRFDDVRRAVITSPRDTLALRNEIVAMREKVRAAHPCRKGKFDVKHAPGGMVDAEFAVQFLVLSQAAQHPGLADNVGNIALLQRAEQAGLLPAGVGQDAASAYRELRRVQHRARLNEEPTQRSDPALQAERAAIQRLWLATFK